METTHQPDQHTFGDYAYFTARIYRWLQNTSSENQSTI